MRVSVVRKVGFIILFGMGIFCMMAAIIRVVLIFKVSELLLHNSWLWAWSLKGRQDVHHIFIYCFLIGPYV